MRIIARSTLARFAERHPETRVSLAHWHSVVMSARWMTTGDVMKAFPKAKALNGERVRFEINGGAYRLIAAFKFGSGLCFVKFLGKHAEYDRVDALTISIF